MPATTPLDRTVGIPLWEQLLADLRRRLARGDFAQAFPGELDLVEQYGVSRHTVRAALRDLRAAGVVTATRGRRPRHGPGAQLVAQPACILHSLFEAARLGLEESTPLVHLELLRSLDGEPIALDRAWLPAGLAAPLLSADLGRERFYTELREHAGIVVTGGEETVQAVLPSRVDHEMLGLTGPAPVLSVRRLGSTHGRPVEWRHMLIRADRVTLSDSLGAPPCDEPGTGVRSLWMTPALS